MPKLLLVKERPVRDLRLRGLAVSHLLSCVAEVEEQPVDSLQLHFGLTAQSVIQAAALAAR